MSEPWRIFVYCDDPSHATRRWPVAKFVELPSGALTGDQRWHEETKPRSSVGRVGTGRHLIGDDLPEAGWASDPAVENADVRTRFEFVCRKCQRRRPRAVVVPVRSERLFAVLDGWRDSGVSEVSLAVMAAILARRSER